MIKKVKLDPRAALAEHQKSAKASADDRFAIAEKITQAKPTGLAPARAAMPDTPAAPILVGGQFDLSRCVIGVVVSVPLSLIDLNPLSPRHVYKSDEVDKIAQTLPMGQDVAAHGYVLNGRIQLIDGGTRYRAARTSDKPFLDVKIESPPADEMALFERARALNDQRSATTPLDFALSLQTLMDRGVVSTQDEIVERVPGPDGGKLSKSAVSMYLRIARLPEKLRRIMNDAAETASFVALYSVSGLFPQNLDEMQIDAATHLAMDIIDEIKRRKLSAKQIEALVRSKQQGPAPRVRASASSYTFGAVVGEFKAFAAKGEIELTLKGLDAEGMTRIRMVLIKALEEHAKSQ